MGISCDICKYGFSHDYVKGNYYCKKGCFFNDKPMVANCSDGEIDEWSYNFKYKPYKENKNVSKELMYDELKKILWGIRLKDIDTIVGEINQLRNKITSYREPYKCETCAKKKNVGYMQVVVEIVVDGSRTRVQRRFE